MRYQFIFAAILAIISSVVAQHSSGVGFNGVISPGLNQIVIAQKVFEIKWSPPSSPTGSITISLVDGDFVGSPATVAPHHILDITTNFDNSKGSYQWTVPLFIPRTAERYKILFFLNSDNTYYTYSFPFKLQGVRAGRAS